MGLDWSVEVERIERGCRCEASIVACLAKRFIVRADEIEILKPGGLVTETYQLRVGRSVELMWDKLLHFGHCPVWSC
jgi:hypothetical protein